MIPSSVVFDQSILSALVVSLSQETNVYGTTHPQQQDANSDGISAQSLNIFGLNLCNFG